MEAQHISGFVPRLQEALKSNDEATVFNSAIVLSRYAPDTEGLANALVRFASDPWRQLQALEAIGRLGTAAESIVPQLAEVLKKQVTMSGIGGVGGSMPGMMGGGMGGFPSMGSSGPGMGTSAGSYGMGYGNPSAIPLILSTLDALGPSAAEALPILRQFAEQEGPYQDTARQMLEMLESQKDLPPGVEMPPRSMQESLDPYGGPGEGEDPFR